MVAAASNKATDPKQKKIAIPQTPVSQSQQNSIRNLVIITVVICTLVVLGGGYAIYQLINANSKKAFEVRAQEYYIVAAQKNLQKLKDAEPALADIKKSDGSAPSTFDYVTKRVLPTTPDFQVLLTVINTLEKQTLVNIESVSKDTATGTAATPAGTANQAQSSGIQTSQLTFKVSGNQDQVNTFLRAVEKSARVFDFSSMKLSGDATSISLSVSYRVYNLPKPSIDPQMVPMDQYESNKGKYQ